MNTRTWCFILIAGFCLSSVERSYAQDNCAGNTQFRIGTGVYDITGPAADRVMMGYAMPQQTTGGIHLRLRSRAFVIESPCNGKRVVFVSADLGQIFQGVKQKVVAKLQARHGNLYKDANVLVSATHTHSGPGGFSHYTLYNLSILGYDPQNFDAIVNGIYESIERADANVKAGTIAVAAGDLLDANANRSLGPYLRNLEATNYLATTDTLMTLLKLKSDRGEELGMINWFPVHATSMGNDNHLISSDNKGYASYLFEKLKGTHYAAPNTFVAAFAQAHEGDASPHVDDARARRTGPWGAGGDDFERTRASGEKQFRKALELYDGPTTLLTGGVDFRHRYVRMDAVTVAPEFADGVERTTCPAAIGISMAAGAEDGPGVGREGVSCADTGLGKDVFCTPCQAEKPIVLETGTKKPYPWTPQVLPLQIVRIGNLAIVAVPYESTTMSGRRLLSTVRDQLEPEGVDHYVIAGLANAYSGYVATREEYALQNYEGASTHFGPWTLAAYQQEYQKLASELTLAEAARPSAPGPLPLNLSDRQIGVVAPVLVDDKPLFKSFGSVHRDANPGYAAGQTASVTFWGGNPRNNLMIQGTYLEVQKRTMPATGKPYWQTVANDWDWETKYKWERNLCVPTLACSLVTIEWAIPKGTPMGIYRLIHYGHWKSGWNGKITPYTGTSREFRVTN